MMNRVYTDVSAFRAPYSSSNISFAGLGMDHSDYDHNRWPKGRSYWTQHFYRAPYQNGYYQSGALRGMGDVPPAAGALLVAVFIVGATVLLFQEGVR